MSAGLPADERSHARLMEAVAGSAGGLSGPALRQLGIGLAAAGIIYGAGALVGGAVG